MRVFEYREYKTYLNDLIRSRPKGGRGERARIAESLRCHIAYVSQVLSGKAHFSLEQADLLNRHLGHGEEESDFFLLLVLLARAGTASLRDHYTRKVDETLKRREVLKNRLEFRKTLSHSDQSTYYSAWYYAAIHLLLGIPEFRSRDRIAEYLGLPRAKVNEALEFLTEAGLAKRSRGGYEAQTTSLHLGSDSTMIARHHTNWRLQAVAALERDESADLHYSSVVTIAPEHVPAIRKELVAAIERVRAIVRGSPEKRLYCYALDLFELGRNQ